MPYGKLLDIMTREMGAQPINNTHRNTYGCFWEMNKKGEFCVFEHFCSWCKGNRSAAEKHKNIHLLFSSTQLAVADACRFSTVAQKLNVLFNIKSSVMSEITPIQMIMIIEQIF